MSGNSIASVALCVLAWSVHAGCYRSTPPTLADRGAKVAEQYGCPACHDIPTLSPKGRVGPPLRGVAQRAFVAGTQPNTPDAMAEWIRFPDRLRPETIMPNLGIPEDEARSLVAFLHSHR